MIQYCNIYSGVPQDAHLSHILILLFINNSLFIIKYLNIAYYLLFSNDTDIYKIVNS